MSKDIEKILQEKAIFVKAAERLLKSDPRSEVKELRYKAIKFPESEYEEMITITFNSGFKKRIVTTCNSNQANLEAIVREVYH